MNVDVTIIAAIIALGGVVVSSFISKLISGRTLYINAVTVERSKWIDKLRDNIAKCSGDLRTLSYKVEAAYARIAVAPVNLQEQDDLVEKINRLISLVSLQLNPFGEIDKNILTILAKMPALAGSPNGQKLRIADELLIKHSQWLLKPYPDELMDAHDVSAIFNSAKYDGPDCIRPVSDDDLPRAGQLSLL
jgi:hypothetical protein